MSVPARILIVVPARGGSKRLPRKNMRMLGGKTLIARTFEAVLDAGLDDAVCLLTTEDEEIRTAAEGLGYWVPFLRPDKFATDAASTEIAVIHAIEEVSKIWQRAPDLLMLLQPTTPFRSGHDLRKAVQFLDSSPDAPAVLSVKRVNRAPAQLFLQGSGHQLTALSASTEPVFTANGALYLIRTATFLESGHFAPPGTLAFETVPESDLDIDTYDDWSYAELMLKRLTSEKGSES